jgi:hypothetical protein
MKHTDGPWLVCPSVSSIFELLRTRVLSCSSTGIFSQYSVVCPNSLLPLSEHIYLLYLVQTSQQLYQVNKIVIFIPNIRLIPLWAHDRKCPRIPCASLPVSTSYLSCSVASGVLCQNHLFMLLNRVSSLAQENLARPGKDDSEVDIWAPWWNNGLLPNHSFTWP